MSPEIVGAILKDTTAATLLHVLVWFVVATLAVYAVYALMMVAVVVKIVRYRFRCRHDTD